MKVLPITYFEWLVENYPKTELDLSNSSIKSVNLTELEFTLSDIELGPPGLGGNPELRRLISEQFEVSEKNILLSPGSSMANFAIAAVLLEPGDNVILETPTYEPLLRIPEALGMEIIRIDRRYENGFQIDIDELNELINKNTKLIMITNLNNPTGIGMDERQLKAVLELAEDNDAFLLSDEVYREYGFEAQPPTVFSISNERGITTDSVTKFYGLGGIRVGWAFCGKELVKKAKSIIELVTLINSTVGERVGIEVFKRLDRVRERTRKIIAENHPLLKQWLTKHQDHFDYILSENVPFCFPKVSREIDVEALVTLLIEKYKILVAPGRFFGDNMQDHIRVGVGYCTKEGLEQGLELFSIALEEITNG